MDGSLPMSVHRSFGIFSRDPSLVRSILEALPSKEEFSYSAQSFQSIELVRDYLFYELPDFLILDLDLSAEDLQNVERILAEDPWLGGVGILGMQGTIGKNDFLELSARWNLIALTSRDDIQGFERSILNILRTPALVLDYQKTAPFHSDSSGTVKLPNDLKQAEKLSGVIASYLLRSGRIDKKKFYHISMSLSELLINAIEHGNCKISFSDKTRLLDAGINLSDYIEELNVKNPSIGKREVTLEYKITDHYSTWLIRDMGDGFDVKTFMNPDNQDLLLSHGRGILMALHSSDSLTYNEKGNEVTLLCNHQKEDECRIPKGFINEEILEFMPGDTIFAEDEESTHLYYILNGEFKIEVGGALVGHLVPADVFLGEMSFLLNRRRTASVTACKKSRLLKISHRSFIRIIKSHPHYMLMLSRVLAFRLERSNLHVG